MLMHLRLINLQYSLLAKNKKFVEDERDARNANRPRYLKDEHPPFSARADAPARAVQFAS